MYRPAQFSSDDPQVAIDLMRAHPFASLISVDEAGGPVVSHLPLHWQAPSGTGPGGVGGTWGHLLGHLARANPHADLLQNRPRALVTFMGPQAFMSPRVYPDLMRVPTWNYLAVHCEVEATILDDPADKDALLKYLIADHDPAYADQWRSLPKDYSARMLQGIVAFSLDIISLECTAKLNQHRPEARTGMLEAYDQGTPDARALADWMRRLGDDPQDKP